MRQCPFSFALVVVVLGLGAACPSTPPPPEDGGILSEEDQSPPEGDTAVQEWLAGEHHRAWTCHDAIGDGSEASPHGRRLICWNDLLVSADGDGEIPVGAAAVKEIYDDNDERSGTSVLLKVAEGQGGDSFYWFERLGAFTVSDGRDSIGCTGCHNGAVAEGGREMFFTRPE